MMIHLVIAGDPRPQGSMRAIPTARGPRIIHDKSAQLLNWRNSVAWGARNAMEDRPPVRGPVSVTVVFRFARPKGHFGTGRNSEKLKPSAPSDHIQKPDIDKLERALLDALTGIVFVDDCQVISVRADKMWGDLPGTSVWVSL